MTKPDHEHSHSIASPEADAESHRIGGSTEKVFSQAQEAVRAVADQATHLAQDTLERGHAAIRQADQTIRSGNSDGDRRRGTSALATALAVGAMGYAIATLIRGATRKRAPASKNALQDKVLPAS
ncbi:hypothetical protein [Methylobacterium sp. Leaf117]|uniref:hypothetical protein n=1 Tax=Methylobacterium sp. Leaf117 TaxID=1736260 RepID=UPI0006F25529|nr:hypothetical protein [Methylobacterium sp. Leaf117]KQP77496.1 hypothetical protein ASF57_19545 [Methylobacterium sp. Leaf117]